MKNWMVALIVVLALAAGYKLGSDTQYRQDKASAMKMTDALVASFHAQEKI